MKIEKSNFIPYCLERFQQTLEQFTAVLPTETALGKAMRYSLCAGGKRIRPLLVYAAAEINAAPWERRDQTALSVEMMHTYSLIHDDLPCMDNAELRRNLPTCHRAFNEHLAVLAGDALQMQAMHILSAPLFHTHFQHQLQMIQILSKACGAHGMVLGQALDMQPTTHPTVSHLQHTHALKTGAVFAACLQLGYLCSETEIHRDTLTVLADIGTKMGVAFQIQDDIFDVTVSEQQLGKTTSDHTGQKTTYATLLGIEAAWEEYQRLYQHIVNSLTPLPHSALLLSIITALHHRQK